MVGSSRCGVDWLCAFLLLTRVHGPRLVPLQQLLILGPHISQLGLLLFQFLIITKLLRDQDSVFKRHHSFLLDNIVIQTLQLLDPSSIVVSLLGLSLQFGLHGSNFRFHYFQVLEYLLFLWSRSHGLGFGRRSVVAGQAYFMDHILVLNHLMLEVQ